MGYKRSTARNEFEVWQARTLKVVAKAEKKYAVASDMSDYALCAALFLTHARFENYIRDICSSYVRELNSKSICAGLLPGRLRECALLAAFPHDWFKNYYIFDDERKLLDNLNTTLTPREWTWATNAFIGHLEPKEIIGNAGYPSPANFQRLFYKLGFSNIYGDLGKHLRTDIPSLLDGIGGLRCEMAHNGMPPLVTASDIAQKIKKLGLLVKWLDRLIHAKLSKL